ncbi:GntR family transcriptional regulator [Listeria ivanovii]|uniref:GntR family transcriptional regulator n=1 Tax=Listeria ivanovii (strain ATCC BAA-678 / PAM 55) TaxID=881621 RepID=G2ZDX5_LISIP|nr:GntR family transcriptional regulator [Listeria ivanovii]AHI56660.1 GntR family transcriptional regulator [Listeria ivanovii WSLC3009]AIS66077.1 GntR family transcriptional regulator [Listeria ivanovii subsp. ivanovii]MBC1760793.1 GntR family transcriptional regulator [Listeria ivanovii]MBK3913901.1 GntR family transcriptional regulator [Listeria ivanovii subsp. ivanovii]MBK3921261.1 GntR family transcriptional regulator [Listeria ivanovii subsp. ivanovii]
MEKSGYVADPIYGEIKNEIMTNTLGNGEKVGIDDIMKRFQVSKQVAFGALHCLHKSGMLCEDNGGQSFSVTTKNEAEHREKSRLKLAFFHLNYAVQKLQDQDAEICATCLRKELVYIKLAVADQNTDVFIDHVKNFYACMIHYTEMPAMEKNIDTFTMLLQKMKIKNEKLFFDAFIMDITESLEELVNHLEAREFEECHLVIQKFYDKNISILFS